MRQKLLLLLLAILAASLLAIASDFEVDRIQYSFTPDGKAVIVSGATGDYKRINIPNTVQYSGNEFPVVAIGDNALSNCRIETLSFGENVTEIGDYAFASSYFYEKSSLQLNLENIKIIGKGAFKNVYGYYRTSSGHAYNDGLRTIIFSSIEKIGEEAFASCKVKTINFNQDLDVDYIGDKAFYGSNVETINFDNSVYLNSIGTEVFHNTPWYNNITGGAICLGKYFYEYKGAMPNNTHFVLEDGTLGIAPNAFQDKTGLLSITMPNTVKFISDGVFSGCTGLTSINIGKSVESLGVGVFSGCTSLVAISVDAGNPKYDSRNNCNAIIETATNNLIQGSNNTVIPNSITKISAQAFKGLTGLTNVTIPSTVTDIGENAFEACTGLTDLTWNAVNCETNGNMTTSNIERVTIGGSVQVLPANFLSGSKITTVTIPSSVTTIGACAFQSCSNLTKAVLPNNVKAVPNYMFSGCNALTNVTLGNAVESFGDYAFSYCNSLKGITIPATVKTIGSSAFYNCTGLTSLTIPAGVTSVGSNAFGGCTGITTLNYRAKALANPGNLNGMTEVATVNFDSNATVVPANLLPNYPKLALVNVGKDVANIAEGAFDNCDALKTMNYDAANCASGELAIASLDTLTLGTNVKSIAANMFYNCKNMKKIVCKATTPPELGNGMVFPNGRYIGVPSNVGAKYKEKWAKISNGTYTRVLPLPIYDLNLESGLLVSGKPFVTTRAYSESKAECSETGYIIEDNSNSGNKIKIQPTYTSSNDQYVYFSHSKLSDYMLPGHSYQIRPYVVVNSVEYDGYYWADIEIPALQSAYQSNVGPSSIILTDDTAIPENINFTSATFSLNNKTYESYGNDIIVTGLQPNTWYYGNYSVAVNEGDVNSTNINFRTPALTLNTQPVKMLTNTAARLEAYTNLSEEETSCGFLWKRYDAPESMLGNPVYCPVYEGTMTGTLKNLPEGVYYQYRAFYRDSEGKLYYGDDSWVAFYTGDATVEFEPVAHTYDNARVSGANAIIQGVALRGSKDITEQGFEYWVDGPAQSEAHMAPSTVNKVTATGERMTSTLTSLKGGSNYSFRAYVKTADGTTYGEVRTFRTPVTAMPGDVNGDGVVSGADVTALYNVLLDGSDAAGDADVNGDGVVSGADVTALYNLLLN